ncbi:MAG: DUF2889 domain-containing protein [Novosphingobium sp.]|nr:DUF2889 domain-containing protein [Novosphingobium sp.]
MTEASAFANEDPWTMPGYRRRIRVEPRTNAVLAMLEDDIHGLSVILRHDGEKVLSVEPEAHRMPWDTCPGAVAKLIDTFAGQPLSEVTPRREKKANCTHLHDLAVLAATHAGDSATIVYDIVATDPVDARRILEIRANGKLLHRWIEHGGTLKTPDAIAGHSLLTLRDWIATLEGIDQEAARLLQWGSLVAHGRTMPLEEQSRAADLPPNCYTFQPERAARANRVGDRFDFSDGTRVPLAQLADKMLERLEHE